MTGGKKKEEITVTKHKSKLLFSYSFTQRKKIMEERHEVKENKRG